MSAVFETPPPEASVTGSAATQSPNQRAWARFKRNRVGFVSLWIFGVLLLLATAAELISNDRPLVARDAYVASESRRLVDRLFGGRAAPLVAHLAETQALSAEDIAELEALVRELKA